MKAVSTLAALAAVTTQLVIVSSQALSAEGCAAYPYSEGMNLEDVEGGVKIIATAEVVVSFDDLDSIKDARDEATIAAKAIIMGFLSEGIKREDTINKAIQVTKSMQGEQKIQIRTETLNKVQNLASATSGLIRGVVPLGDCYDKGRLLRVSVGIKPETIAAAGSLSGAVSKSLSTSPSPTSTNVSPSAQSGAGASGSQRSPSGGQSLQGVDSFNNSDRLKKF